MQKFEAPSMSEALRRVKEALGDSAVIISTRSIGGDGSPRRVEITASGSAVAIAGARPRPSPASEQIPAIKTWQPETGPAADEQIIRRLVENDIAREIAIDIVQEARRSGKAGSPESIRAALSAYIQGSVPKCGGIELPLGRTKWIALVGPPGAGKTTMLAKLTAHFKLRMRRTVGIVSLDTQRLGAPEQLQRYADLIEAPLRTAQSPDTLGVALQELQDLDLVLFDTPGIGLREPESFSRLAELLGSVGADETYLVLPVSLKVDVQERILRLFNPLGVTRLVLTRLDEAVGLGVVLNVAARLERGVAYISSGQNVPRDLEEACTSRLAELIF